MVWGEVVLQQGSPAYAWVWGKAIISTGIELKRFTVTCSNAEVFKELFVSNADQEVRTLDMKH